MQIKDRIVTALQFLKKHWFNICLLGFILFIFLKKDFRFQINLNAPLQQQEQLTPETESMERPVVQRKKKEQMTENRKEATLLDKLSLPFIGGEKPVIKKANIELAKIDEAIQLSYLKRFIKTAIAERKKYGIPSSIILANALLHSLSGQRDIAQQSNNHFGIPCTIDWQGETGMYQNSCYRQYENAWTSFRDHSLYITHGKYTVLRQIEPTDYKGWAKALEDKGFSEEPDLAAQLIYVIETYGLDKLDKE